MPFPLHAAMPVDATNILSIRILLDLRGSPGVTLRREAQPALFVLIKAAAVDVVPRLKFSPPPVPWHCVHKLPEVKIPCMVPDKVIFVLATPSMVEANREPLEDLTATVTYLSVGAEGMVTLVVIRFEVWTVTVPVEYAPPRLSVTLIVMPLAKLVPVMDKARGVPDATIPTGEMEVMVAVAATEPPPPPPPQEAILSDREAIPAILLICKR